MPDTPISKVVDLLVAGLVKKSVTTDTFNTP